MGMLFLRAGENSCELNCALTSNGVPADIDLRSATHSHCRP